MIKFERLEPLTGVSALGAGCGDAVIIAGYVFVLA
jgi:hypothetical protein